MKRSLPRKLRDRRSSLSTYARRGKRPFNYSATPLHKDNQHPSQDAIDRFEARLGIVHPRKPTNRSSKSEDWFEHEQKHRAKNCQCLECAFDAYT